MNNERRKQIDDIISRLEMIADDILAVKDAEQEAFDNIPESLQEADRGQTMSDAIDTLENIDVQEIIDNLTAAKGDA